MSRIETYLSQLNEPQREAVLENERPLLVLAGAGSGKTRVITTKIAYAVDVLGLPPWKILAVTFTNKAATEMRNRVSAMLDGTDVSEMQIRTFHSFGAWLLRRYGAAIGLGDNFTIYDDDDSLSLLASCFPEYKKVELAPFAKSIALAKDMGLSPFDAQTAELNRNKDFPRMFEAYQRKLRSVGNVDFADLISLSIDLLQSSAEVRRQIHGRFKMVLVDEYQDSNIAQFKLLKLLVGERNFICVVGDDDQSIYRFRGAEVRNILSFPDVYPGTRIIKLEQNYRSTANILAIAQAVIANNVGRHPKTLWTSNPQGAKSRLVHALDEKEEAQRCARLIRESGDYDRCAILYRTNAQSVAFETLFSRLEIPYKVVGALRFYDREEVKDALALLFLLLNPNDAVNFRRMVNKPARGIGDTSMQKIIDAAAYAGVPVLEGCRTAAEQDIVTGKAAAGAKQFAALFDEARRRLEHEGNAACIGYLLEASGIQDHYRKHDEQNKTGKVDNLGAVVSAVSDYPDGRDGLLEFLESLMLDPTKIGHEDPSDKPGVTLITMHNTKGLEFDRVFITGMEEGLFPGRSCESDDDLEEERRIFYVAITRARRELYVFTCRQRMLWGKTNWQMPSRFIAEVPQDLVVVEGAQPMPRGNFDDDSYHGFGSLEEKRWKSQNNQMAGRSSFGSSGGRRNSNIIGTPSHPASSEAVVVGSSDSKRSFSLGERVFHEDYGEGQVQAVRTLRERQIVDVVFTSGKRASFFSNAPVLEKLGSAW